MTDLESNHRTEQLANPFRPGNGVAPPFLAGRDALLGEFERYLGETHPPHANWTLTGIRGTGKTVLLGEFATRGERAGWLCLGRELSDRHRDDARLADAIADDCAALIRRCNSLAGLGDAIERAWQYVRPRRVSVGELGYEPAYETESRDAAEVIGAALTGARRCARADRRPGRPVPVRRSPPARRRPTVGALPALVAPRRVRAGAADVEPGAPGPVRAADPEPQPQAGTDVCRADVPPRGHRPSRTWRCLGRARDPALGQRSRLRSPPRRRDRGPDGRLSVLPAVLRRLPVQPGRPGRRRARATTRHSSRACSTSSTSPSSRTATSSPAWPASGCSMPWPAPGGASRP